MIWSERQRERERRERAERRRVWRELRALPTNEEKSAYCKALIEEAFACMEHNEALRWRKPLRAARPEKYIPDQVAGCISFEGMMT